MVALATVYARRDCKTKDSASAELTAGKNADAIRKLTDFRTKVQTLGSTGKLERICRRRPA